MPLTSPIRAYDPGWPRLYRDAAAELTPVFGEALVGIHHVGSTAVPGLSAKPEIDVLAIAEVAEVPDPWLTALQAMGYQRGGDLSPGHRFFKRDVNGIRTHKLHLCREGHPAVSRMLRFRDHLRRHAVDRQRYDALKRRLEQANTEGISEYLAAKAPFIQSVLDNLE